jgi:uncharacterized coiled-coil DUF342 family protein
MYTAPQQTGDTSSLRDPAIENEIANLVDDLKNRDEKYKNHMGCAIKRLAALQIENNELREYIASLENDLEQYSQMYDDNDDEADVCLT